MMNVDVAIIAANRPQPICIVCFCLSMTAVSCLVEGETTGPLLVARQRVGQPDKTWSLPRSVACCRRDCGIRPPDPCLCCESCSEKLTTGTKERPTRTPGGAFLFSPAQCTRPVPRRCRRSSTRIYRARQRDRRWTNSATDPGIGWKALTPVGAPSRATFTGSLRRSCYEHPMAD